MGFAGFLLSSPSAAEETKRTRIYVSVLGGSLAGVKFLNVFDYVSTSTGWEFSANVSDESGIQKASAMTYGFSIGYLRGLGDPGEKHYAFSYYVELSAFPKTKLPDGIETETVWDYGATINTYAQTGRKAGLFGLTAGIVWMPFDKIPVGFDAGLGIWRFTQEYISPACKTHAGGAKTSLENKFTIVSYCGNGLIENNHISFSFKLGLAYRLYNFLSLSPSVQWIWQPYIRKYRYGWIPAGQDYGTQLLAIGLASLFVIELKFLF